MNWVLCDTNIFISAFNGIEKTISDLSQIGSRNVLIPSISVMELSGVWGINRKCL